MLKGLVKVGLVVGGVYLVGKIFEFGIRVGAAAANPEIAKVFNDFYNGRITYKEAKEKAAKIIEEVQEKNPDVYPKEDRHVRATDEVVEETAENDTKVEENTPVEA